MFPSREEEEEEVTYRKERATPGGMVHTFYSNSIRLVSIYFLSEVKYHINVPNGIVERLMTKSICYVFSRIVFFNEKVIKYSVSWYLWFMLLSLDLKVLTNVMPLEGIFDGNEMKKILVEKIFFPFPPLSCTWTSFSWQNFMDISEKVDKRSESSDKECSVNAWPSAIKVVVLYGLLSLIFLLSPLLESSSSRFRSIIETSFVGRSKGRPVVSYNVLPSVV